MPREEIITSINLAQVLNLQPSSNPDKDLYIITRLLSTINSRISSSFVPLSKSIPVSIYLSHTNAAFHVHSVIGITRISWADILKPDATLNANGDSVATGIIKLDGRL